MYAFHNLYVHVPQDVSQLYITSRGNTEMYIGDFPNYWYLESLLIRSIWHLLCMHPIRHKRMRVQIPLE